MRKTKTTSSQLTSAVHPLRKPRLDDPFPSRHHQKRRYFFGYFSIYTPFVLLWETTQALDIRSYSPISLILSIWLFIRLFYFIYLPEYQASAVRLRAISGILIHGMDGRASSIGGTLFMDSISTTSTNIFMCIIARLGSGAVLGVWVYDVLPCQAMGLNGSVMTNIQYRHVPSSRHCEFVKLVGTSGVSNTVYQQLRPLNHFAISYCLGKSAGGFAQGYRGTRPVSAGLLQGIAWSGGNLFAGAIFPSTGSSSASKCHEVGTSLFVNSSEASGLKV
jgi:hypothetical protein